MFPDLPSETQTELLQLAQSYGQPLIETTDLGSTTRFDPLNRTDRYGEVCMVMRRPNSRLLTMKKTFYPPNAFRLLTGGINHQESILTALQREVQEETGLDTLLQRFLVAVAYRTADGGDKPVFYTFAFLLDESGGTLNVNDESEQVEAFREIEPRELPELAAYLSQLHTPYSPTIGGTWDDWGKFRAVIHTLVWQAFQRFET